MLAVDGTDDVNGADGTDEIRRKRRSAETSQSNSKVNM